MASKNAIVVAVVAVLMVAAVGAILLLPSSDAKDLQITILAQANSEGSAIFVKNSMMTYEEGNGTDWGGKVFATPGPASIQHMMLMNHVLELGYNFQSAPGVGQPKSNTTVYWTAVAPINMNATLASGDIDGGIAWEPYNSQIVAAGTGKIYIWSDELIAAHPCCVVAADTKFLKNNPETVERFLAGHILATQWILDTLADPTSDNYTLMLQMGAAFSGLTEAIVEDSLGHVTFDYQIDQDWKDALEQVVDTYTTLGLFQNTLEDIGYDSTTAFVNAIVNTQHLENAASIDIVDENATLINVRVGWLVGDVHQLARLVGMNQTVGQGFGFGDRSIFQAYGLNIVGGAGNPYANGGAVMDAFIGGAIDIGYLGAPPAILRTVNAAA